jgi:hypothetical protein
VTPNGAQGGIWEAGDGISVDPQGYLYAAVGNGTFDTTLNSAGFPIDGDYGDSVIKLAIDPTSTPTSPNINGYGLKVVDYFTPMNQQVLSDEDLDLGSSGITILPDSAGSLQHRHLIVTAGKEGKIYLIDRDNMGKFRPQADHVVQEVSDGKHLVLSSPAFFNSTLYYAAVNDTAKAFKVARGKIAPKLVSQTNTTFPMRGATPAISSRGAKNGVF